MTYVLLLADKNVLTGGLILNYLGENKLQGIATGQNGSTRRNVPEAENLVLWLHVLDDWKKIFLRYCRCIQ